MRQPANVSNCAGFRSPALWSYPLADAGGDRKTAQTATCAVLQMSSLFDDLVGSDKESLRHGEAECLGVLYVDHQFEFNRGLDGKIARLRALQDAIDIRRRTPELIEKYKGRKRSGRQFQRMNETNRWRGHASEQQAT